MAKLKNKNGDSSELERLDQGQSDESENNIYHRPLGTQSLGVDLKNMLDRMVQAPMLVAVMSAKPSKIAIGKSEVPVLISGLIMGSHGFYGIESGFPSKYQVVIDEAIPVKEAHYIDPLTVRLVISTEHARPGTYDISFSNSLGETLTGLRVLTIGEFK
jgi:hypothetical protein